MMTLRYVAGVKKERGFLQVGLVQRDKGWCELLLFVL